MNNIKKILVFIISCLLIPSTYASVWGQARWDVDPWDESFSNAMDENYGLTWTSSGHSQWVIQTTYFQVGSSSLQSGSIGNYEQSTIETVVTGVQSISFYWKVSSESGYDFFKFYIDGIEMASIDGEVYWQHQTFQLSPGSHILQWTYSKDGSSFSGIDAGWLDGVSTRPVMIVPILFLLE